MSASESNQSEVEESSDELGNNNTDNVLTEVSNEANREANKKRKGENKAKINKHKRMKGESYTSTKKTTNGKISMTKPPRHMGPACGMVHRQTKNFSKKCHEISDETRQKIFNDFWAMDWATRRVYVASDVHVEKKSTGDENSRRGSPCLQGYLLGNPRYR